MQVAWTNELPEFQVRVCAVGSLSIGKVSKRAAVSDNAIVRWF